MSEMVEVVTKALVCEMFAPHELPLDAELQGKIQAMARAAIAAMREPTEDMYRAAMPHMDSYSSNTTWWQAMIDGALK